MTGSSSLRVLAGLAQSQGGLVTSAQGRQAGVSLQEQARLARLGLTDRVRHGVYRVGGAPTGEHERIYAGWLALDPARSHQQRLADPTTLAVVSHQSAARLHDLGDIDADQLEYSAPTRKQPRDPEITIHRRPRMPAWTVVDGIPVTTVLATIDDLARTGIDGGHLAGIVRDALISRYLPLPPLLGVLAEHAAHYGAPAGDGTQLLHVLLSQAGIPATLLELARLLDPPPTQPTPASQAA